MVRYLLRLGCMQERMQLARILPLTLRWKIQKLGSRTTPPLNVHDKPINTICFCWVLLPNLQNFFVKEKKTVFLAKLSQSARGAQQPVLWSIWLIILWLKINGLCAFNIVPAEHGNTFIYAVDPSGMFLLYWVYICVYLCFVASLKHIVLANSLLIIKHEIFLTSTYHEHGAEHSKMWS